VEELTQVKTMCLCVTSRISTVPRHCKRPIISTLSGESACDIFYDIYDTGDRSDTIRDLLRRLDFHALSITLLATVASHTQVLRTDYGKSLAATVELSLASPTFHELGPDARDLLGVIAFFLKASTRTTSTGCFPQSPTEKTSSTNSVPFLWRTEATASSRC